MMPWLQQIVTGAWRPGYRSMHATCGVWRNAPGARCSFRRQDASIYKLLKGASRRVGDPFGLGVDVRLDDCCVCACVRASLSPGGEIRKEGAYAPTKTHGFSRCTHTLLGTR